MNRKAISLMLIVVMLLSVSLAAMANNKIKDLSKEHWAYQGVVELVEKGYLSLYEDNKFKGEKEVTRYQLSEIIAKILNNIEQGRVAPEKQDIVTLKKLATEFRTELVQVVQKSEKAAKKVDGFKKEQKIFNEELTKTKDNVNKLQRQVSEIIADLKEEVARINQLKSQIKDLEEDKSILEERVNKLEVRLNQSNNTKEVEKINRKLFWLAGGWAVSVLLLMSK